MRPKVPLLDEVEEGEARRLVFFGDGHHQPEVGLDEGLLSPFTLQGDTAQLPFFGWGQAFGAAAS